MALNEAGIAVSQRAVSGWETGAIPRAEITKRLAEFFDVTIDTLTDETRSLPKTPFEKLREVSEHVRSVEEVAGVYATDVADNLVQSIDSKHRQEHRATAKRLREWAGQLIELAEHLEHMTILPDISLPPRSEKLQTTYPITMAARRKKP